MTSVRAHNAFRKMRPGSIGGQSRVATPVSPGSLANPVGLAPTPTPTPVVFEFLGHSNVDSSTQSHGAFSGGSDAAAGELVINCLVDICASPPVDSGNFTLRLDTVVEVSGHAQLNTRISDGVSDALAWTWASDAAAWSSTVVVQSPSGVDYLGSDNFDMGGLHFSEALSGHRIVFVWSGIPTDGGGATLIHRSDMILGTAVLESWYWPGGLLEIAPGIGNLLYVSAVEIG